MVLEIQNDWITEQGQPGLKGTGSFQRTAKRKGNLLKENAPERPTFYLWASGTEIAGGYYTTRTYGDVDPNSYGVRLDSF